MLQQHGYDAACARWVVSVRRHSDLAGPTVDGRRIVADIVLFVICNEVTDRDQYRTQFVWEIY